jgi:hypothetical protein
MDTENGTSRPAHQLLIGPPSSAMSTEILRLCASFLKRYRPHPAQAEFRAPEVVMLSSSDGAQSAGFVEDFRTWLSAAGARAIWALPADAARAEASLRYGDALFFALGDAGEPAIARGVRNAVAQVFDCAAEVPILLVLDGYCAWALREPVGHLLHRATSAGVTIVLTIASDAELGPADDDRKRILSAADLRVWRPTPSEPGAAPQPKPVAVARRAALTFAGRHGIMTTRQLRTLLTITEGRQASVDATRSALMRWRDKGLVETERRGGRSLMFWLTTAGTTACGLPHRGDRPADHELPRLLAAVDTDLESLRTGATFSKAASDLVVTHR